MLAGFFSDSVVAKFCFSFLLICVFQSPTITWRRKEGKKGGGKKGKKEKRKEERKREEERGEGEREEGRKRKKENTRKPPANLGRDEAWRTRVFSPGGHLARLGCSVLLYLVEHKWPCSPREPWPAAPSEVCSGPPVACRGGCGLGLTEDVSSRDAPPASGVCSCGARSAQSAASWSKRVSLLLDTNLGKKP